VYRCATFVNPADETNRGMVPWLALDRAGMAGWRDPFRPMASAASGRDDPRLA